MTESVYHDLNIERHEIRLLKLAPGEPQDPIHVRLSTISLDATPPPVYEAISYVWGNPNVTENIKISSVGFPVTTNLKAALARFRLPDRTRMLWADAICIDQQNISERSSQVQIMERIYSQCEGVLVYLGAEEPGDKEAFDFINSPGKTENAFTNCERLSWIQSELTCKTVFRQFGHLVAKEWWSRSWTVQEIVLAPHSFIALVWPIRLNRDVALEDRKDILEIVVVNRPRVSTDPRDKVFAFLGMAHPSHYIASDYSAGVEEVYINFAWTSFIRLVTLQALGSVDSNQQSGFQLASWVPDWTKIPFSSIQFKETTKFYAYNTFNACADQPFDGVMDVSSANPALILSGLKVGEVAKVSANCDFMPGSIMMYNLSSWCEVADVNVEPLRSYVTRQCCIREAFWRTVMMDTRIPGYESEDLAQRPIPPEFEAPFWGLLEMSESTLESLVRNGEAGGAFEAGFGSAQAGIQLWAEGRRFGILGDGNFVNGPPGAEVGDEVWIAKGGKMPLMLRRTEASGQGIETDTRPFPQFEFVGDCYVHGIMDGEKALDAGNNYREIRLL